MIAARVISLCIGYVCGLFLGGYFIGKIKHKDIREFGSGNVGTTNATRAFGLKGGLFTLVCDIVKGFVAAGIVCMIFKGKYDGLTVKLLASYAAFGAMLGHMFPFYMGFKGGKGVATSLSFLALCVPQTIPLCVLTFIVVVVLTRYVSLGSILGVIVVVLQLFLFGSRGRLFYSGAMLKEVTVLVCVAAVIVIIKHHENIGRLLRGEENKFGRKRKADKSSHMQS
ncbi:MAG: glycerol-3-phosphate 1-O-acyltransferase PlsY [Lachnospiraceae bacterium]|nr:glycerol-3-phosphate 1-O-acyltransferase PlsY [Lachnospiraceae bacterium]